MFSGQKKTQHICDFSKCREISFYMSLHFVKLFIVVYIKDSLVSQSKSIMLRVGKERKDIISIVFTLHMDYFS